MNTTHLLDPRVYSLDAMLRRPYLLDTPWGAVGEHLKASSPQGWGFANGIFWENAGDGRELPLFRVSIGANAETILPGDAVFRPSSVSLHGVGERTGLQVTEDKFLTRDDVAVSVLSIRNPTDEPMEVVVEREWLIGSGGNAVANDATAQVYRESPPGDDLRFRLNGFTHRTLTFALGIAGTLEEAQRRVRHWRRGTDALREHQERFLSWFEGNMPLFDCPDPFITRLWYHHWQVVRQQGANALLPLPTDLPENREARLQTIASLARSEFMGGDFDRPATRVTAWATLILTRLLGVGRQEDRLTVAPRLPQNAWPHFCLENLSLRGRNITLVWDDPAESEDAYHDRDKGLTVYINGRPAFHQETLDPFSVDLTPFPQTIVRADRS